MSFFETSIKVAFFLHLGEEVEEFKKSKKQEYIYLCGFVVGVHECKSLLFLQQENYKGIEWH